MSGRSREIVWYSRVPRTNDPNWRTRKYNAFVIADVLKTPDFWPTDQRNMFYARHLNHQERFRQWMFLWGNGVHPYACTHWVLWNGGYDRQAAYDMYMLEEGALGRHPRTRERMMKVRTFNIL